jgi:two-component system, chemotaxis family, sensor kinase CheA
MFKTPEKNKSAGSKIIYSRINDVSDPYASSKVHENNHSETKRILLVDDDITIRNILDRLLTSLKFDVRSVDNGLDALNLFMNEGFELVLSDIQMPGMDGWELTSNIKKKSPGTPVILITGMDKSYVEKEMKNNRADSVLFKPFNLKQLKSTLSSFLNDGDEQVNPELSNRLYL